MGGALLVFDLHLGDSTHDDGLGFREEEANRICAAIVKQAREHKVDVVAFVGDTYHHRKPPQWAVRIFNRLVAALREFTQVRIIPGNHDGDSAENIGPLSVEFLTADEYVTSPRTEQFGVIAGDRTMFQLLFLPWFSRSTFSAIAPGTPANVQHAQMVSVFSELVSAKTATLMEGVPTATLTHFTIAGASYNSDVQPMLGDSSEFMLPRTAFSTLCGTVFAGHVHKPQMLPHIEGLADVIYGGSAIHHDFGESHRCSTILWSPGAEQEMVRLPLPAIEFVTLELGIERTEDEIRGAIVRFKGELPAGPESAAILKNGEARLLSSGALKVAKAAITFNRHEHREVSSITTATDPLEAMAEYIGVVGGDFTARKEEVLRVHVEILEEVRS